MLVEIWAALALVLPGFVRRVDAAPRGRVAVCFPSQVVGRHPTSCTSWDALHARDQMRRINYWVAFSKYGACTNRAESFFSRLRHAEMVQHQHISGKYLGFYAAEMAPREDNRRIANGAQHAAATGAALGHPVSRVWKGYWQR